MITRIYCLAIFTFVNYLTPTTTLCYAALEISSQPEEKDNALDKSNPYDSNKISAPKTDDKDDKDDKEKKANSNINSSTNKSSTKSTPLKNDYKQKPEGQKEQEKEKEQEKQKEQEKENLSSNIIKKHNLEIINNIEDRQIRNNIYILIYDSNVLKRRLAALFLGQYYFSGARNVIVDFLIEALDDEDSKVLINSARSLARLKAHKAIKHIFKLISEDDFNVRNQAVRAIGIIGSLLALKPLIFGLKDKHHQVRISAVWGLSKLQYPDAINHLVDLLFDKNELVRAYVALALGEFKDKRIIPFLLHVYNNDNSLEVRQNAYISLKSLGVILDFPREGSNNNNNDIP